MALKDWTKIKEDKEEIEWRNDKLKTQLELFPIRMVKDSGWGYNIEGWALSISHEPYWSNTSGLKYGLKTKSQALSYAKQYMRTH